MLHGEPALAEARRSSEALFSGDVSGLDPSSLEQVFAEAPASEHPKSALSGAGMDVVELLVATQIVKSKREGRQLVESGAISVNGKRAALEDRVGVGDLLHGRIILLRRGKKHWHVARWT
jgi:tyrosyl-tRNA synthetase